MPSRTRDLATPTFTATLAAPTPTPSITAALPRFTDNGDGTVTDALTRLTWEKKVHGAGCLHCAEDFYAWEPGLAESGIPSAFDWLSEINGQFDGNDPVQPGFAGYNDWRLASRDELWSLVDCSFGETCVDSAVGVTSTDAPYWTFTTLGDEPARAWKISFHLGLVSDDPKSFHGHVRAVRGGTPVPSPAGTGLRYVDNLDGTVTDTETGLMWEKKVVGSSCPHCVDDRYSWEPGTSISGTDSIFDWLSELNGLFTGTGPAQPGFAGYSDWRLPSRDELWTLVNCAAGSPCVDRVVGTVGTVVPYWTSTSVGQNPPHAWLIGFGTGQVTDGSKNVGAYVRAVRGVYSNDHSPMPTSSAGSTPRQTSTPTTSVRSPTASSSATRRQTPTATSTETRIAAATITRTAQPTASRTPTTTAVPTVSPTRTATIGIDFSGEWRGFWMDGPCAAGGCDITLRICQAGVTLRILPTMERNACAPTDLTGAVDDLTGYSWSATDTERRYFTAHLSFDGDHNHLVGSFALYGCAPYDRGTFSVYRSYIPAPCH